MVSANDGKRAGAGGGESDNGDASGSPSKNNRLRVFDAVETLYDRDDNSRVYFRSGDVEDIDSTLSSAVIGSYLPKLAKNSPLDNGLVVEEYTERRCGASLWLVHEDNE